MAGSRVEKKLSALRVKAIKTAGKYEDGGGLRLVVEESGAKRWVLRTTILGRRVERGLGSAPSVTLEAARAKALEFKTAAKAGLDFRNETKREAAAGTTFERMFEISFEQRAKQLSNAKHLKQWPSTMAAYVFPAIGHVPVADVTSAQVLDVLSPIWFDKPETAKRVLQRMETVFKSAIVRGIRARASPCIGVAAELGTKHRDVEHRRSMAWEMVPEFVASLRDPNLRRLPVTALALEFLILTADTQRGDERRSLV